MRKKLLLAAVPLLAGGPAFAQEDEDLAKLTKPQSTIEAGAGYLSDDAPRAGQYNGVREQGGYLLLDIDLLRRDDETGTWTRLFGRNLGFDSRELRFEQNRQGNWGYFLDYSATPRFSPYTVNTPVLGIGTNNLTIPYPAATSAKSDAEIKTEREALALGVSKRWGGGWDVRLRFRNEEKTGARIFGRGTTGGTSFEFTPEPIDWLTQEWEAAVGYASERLQLNGGYVGQRFQNRNQALNVSQAGAGAPAGLAAFTPMGLPPGNDSHQLYLAGGYNFTRATRTTFKLASSRVTQEEQFIIAPSAFVPRTDLGGRIDTTQAQLGISSRQGKLGLRADLRYEDRDDKTPVHSYQTFNATTLLTPANSPTATTDGKNEPRSVRTTAGKLEATYALPAGYRITGGLDYEEKKRNTSDVRSVSYREQTEEIGWRAELRRSLSETVNGALSFVQSKRDGSDWVTTTTLSGAAGSNLVHPLHLADRDRDKLRAVLDWMPLEPLSLQFVAEGARDEYSGRTLGPRKGDASLFSVDTTYRFSDSVQASAWVSRNEIHAEQVTCQSASGVGVCPNTAASPVWEAQLATLGDAFGLGLRSKPSGRFQLDADLTYSKDRSEFKQSPLPVPSPLGTPLPDIEYERIIFKLSGRYALDKHSGLRLQYIYDQFSTDDYAWSAWTYSEGTTLRQEATQKAHFIGLSYIHDIR